MTDTNQSPADVAAFLRRYNEWRRGGAEEMPDPAEIGKAIDAAVKMLAEIPADDGSLTLDKGDVEFLAARVRRLLAKFGEHELEKDDRFIVGVAGSLIGNLLSNIELKEKARPVRLTDDEIETIKRRAKNSDERKGVKGQLTAGRAIEIATLRANGFKVES